MASAQLARVAELEPEYSEYSLLFTEILWGEGFMSPGGGEEVRRIVEQTDLTGADVLDVGCGIGGAAVVLARDLGARRVTGVDTEVLQVDRAQRRAEAAGLTDRLSFRQVVPGPLPFADASFDVVFSKDAIIHVADKAALLAECHRVLKPGGLFLASDWLRRGDGPQSETLAAFCLGFGLTFHLETLQAMGDHLLAAGFKGISLTDRHRWYRDLARQELARMEGPLRPRLVAALGEKRTADDIACWGRMVAVLDAGEFGPGHLRAQKPKV